MRPDPANSRAFAIGVLCLATWAAGSASAAEPRLLATEAAGAVPIGNERWLTVEGFRGDVYVRATGEPEVRFQATRAGEPDTAMDVEVWVDGSSLVLRPPEGDAEPRALEVAVPVSLAVRVFASDAGVVASGLREELAVSGDGLNVDLRGIGGPLSLDLRGGTVSGMVLQGDVTLRGSDFRADLRQVLGFVDAGCAGAVLRLEQAGGGAEIDLDGGGLAVEGLEDGFVLRARDAQVRLQGLQDGARLELEGTPLVLSEGEGEIEIETDSEVRFNEMKASLHVNSWGGGVAGSGNEGLLEVRTDGARVEVEKIAGPMRVQGQQLDVRLADISGELAIYAGASQITVERAGAGLTIENDFGDVTVRRAAGNVKVNVRDGDVELGDLSGAVELWAEAARVEVGWASLRPDGDSRIENARGDVVAFFPPRGGASVEARSGFGRVESELAEIRVQEDGNSAAGVLGNRRRPRVTILAEGSVSLRQGG